MDLRTRFGALLGAGGLLLMAASTVFAAPPTYFIDVQKTADPANVPPSGGSVTYTVWVEATGTGFFQVVNVDDGMAGCTLGAPTGDDDSDGNMEPGETWAFSCTVTGVTPGTQNTAVVNACHNSGGSCNQAAHDATGSDSVTVGEGEEPPATDPPATDPPATDPPATDPPGTDPPGTDPPGEPTDVPADPTFGGDEAGATEPATDTSVASGRTGSGNPLLLVIALGMLLASIVLVTPARPVRQR